MPSLRLLALCLAALLASPIHAQMIIQGTLDGEEEEEEVYEDGVEPEFKRNKHYTVKRRMPPTEAPEGKTELMEFFWYGCPHCFRLEPLLKEWLAERTDTVHLRPLPTVFNSHWAIGARTYYTLEKMDRLDLHPVVFNLVHEQGRPMKSGEGIGRMLATFDVDPTEFAKVFRSEAVTERVDEAKEIHEKYDIEGVPALAVDGKYLITSKHVTSYQMLLDIVDYLIREKP